MRKVCHRLCLFILSIIVISTFLLLWFKPEYIFQRKVGFDLPPSAKIIDSSYYLFDEKMLYLKFIFDEEDLDYILEELESSFPKNNYKMLLDSNPEMIPSFSNCTEWWDMKTEDIEFAYQTFHKGNLSITVEVFVFILRDSEHGYILYFVG